MSMRLTARVLSDAWEGAVAEIERRSLWNELGAWACRARVGGVLHDRLRELGIAVPEETELELAAYRRHVAANNRMQLARALPVVDAFVRAGIPCLVLKGAALLATLYRNRSMRLMVDIDLMIPPPDADRATSILESLDWVAEAPLVREDFFPRFHYERGFVTRSEPRVRIDLHVRPFRPMRYAATIPPDAFFCQSRTASLDGHALRVPDANVMLIHLAVHAACHGARELRWLNDVAAWCRAHRDAIDPAAVEACCHAWKLAWPMRSALAAVQVAFGSVPLVDALMAALPDSAGWIDRLTLWQAPHGDDRHVIDVAVNALATPGLSQRLQYVAAVARPDDAHILETGERSRIGQGAMWHARRWTRIALAPVRRCAS